MERWGGALEYWGVGVLECCVDLDGARRGGGEGWKEVSKKTCRNSAKVQFGNMEAVVSVSGRGLIAIPARLRKAAGIRPKDNLIAEITPDGILLRPAVTLPIELYTPARIAEFDAAESELADVLTARRKRS